LRHNHIKHISTCRQFTKHLASKNIMKPEKAYPKKIKSIRLMYVLKTTSFCRCKTDQALKSDGEEVGEEEEKQGATAWAIEDGRAREVAVAVVSLGWPSPHSQARLQAGEADGLCGAARAPRPWSSRRSPRGALLLFARRGGC
jgi:hypothetical protein